MVILISVCLVVRLLLCLFIVYGRCCVSRLTVSGDDLCNVNVWVLSDPSHALGPPPERVPDYKERLDRLAKNPVAGAIEYERQQDVLFKIVLGWDMHKRESFPGGGLFGIVKAWTKRNDVQERQSLHSHILIWLVGYEKLSKRIADELNQRLLDQLNSPGQRSAGRRRQPAPRAANAPVPQATDASVPAGPRARPPTIVSTPLPVGEIVPGPASAGSLDTKHNPTNATSSATADATAPPGQGGRRPGLVAAPTAPSGVSVPAASSQPAAPVSRSAGDGDVDMKDAKPRPPVKAGAGPPKNASDSDVVMTDAKLPSPVLPASAPKNVTGADVAMADAKALPAASQQKNGQAEGGHALEKPVEDCRICFEGLKNTSILPCMISLIC